MPGFFKKKAHTDGPHFILPAPEQVKAWKKANRKMKWGIPAGDFTALVPPPILSPKDQADAIPSL